VGDAAEGVLLNHIKHCVDYFLLQNWRQDFSVFHIEGFCQRNKKGF
jgi:hypothetical protein